MKPAQFAYVAARDLPHALEVLAGGEAKILAGGQSLVPMMNLRLAMPAVVLDINRIAGLDRIEERGERLRIGALVRHRQTASDPLVAARFPVLTAAMAHVAHPAIRNRGTFVGSLCHADPAAELPMLALLLGAEIEVSSMRGTRRVAADGFFQGPLTTALASDEMAVAVELPFLPAGTGWGFEEFARRRGDFALASVAVTLAVRDGRALGVRMAAMGVGDTPVRLLAAEAVLEGGDLGVLDTVVAAVRLGVAPMDDQHASAEYRRHLVGVLAERAVRAAWERAGR